MATSPEDRQKAIDQMAEAMVEQGMDQADAEKMARVYVDRAIRERDK